MSGGGEGTFEFSRRLEKGGGGRGATPRRGGCSVCLLGLEAQSRGKKTRPRLVVFKEGCKNLAKRLAKRRGGRRENKSFALHPLVLAYEKASTTCKNSFFSCESLVLKGSGLPARRHWEKRNCFVMHKALCLHYIVERTCGSCPPKETTGFPSFRFSHHNPTTHTDISRLLLPLLPTLKYSCAATGK